MHIHYHIHVTTHLCYIVMCQPTLCICVYVCVCMCVCVCVCACVSSRASNPDPLICTLYYWMQQLVSVRDTELKYSTVNMCHMSIKIFNYAVASIHHYHNIRCVIVCQSSLHKVYCVFTLFGVKFLYLSQEYSAWNVVSVFVIKKSLWWDH